MQKETKDELSNEQHLLSVCTNVTQLNHFRGLKKSWKYYWFLVNKSESSPGRKCLRPWNIQSKQEGQKRYIAISFFTVRIFSNVWVVFRWIFASARSCSEKTHFFRVSSPISLLRPFPLWLVGKVYPTSVRWNEWWHFDTPFTSICMQKVFGMRMREMNDILFFFIFFIASRTDTFHNQNHVFSMEYVIE